MPQSLPLPLAGPGLIVYRLLWALAFAAAAASTTIGQYADYRSAAGPESVRLSLGLIEFARGLLFMAGATLLFRRRRDSMTAMLSLGLLLWASTSSASSAAIVGEVGLELIDRLRFVLFAIGLLLFPGGRFKPRWTRHAAAATLLVFLVGLAAGFGIVPPIYYLAPATGCIAAAVLALRHRFRALSPGVARQQIRWVAWGLASGLTLVIVSRLLPLSETAAAGVAIFASPILLNLGTLLMALGLLVALLRYRLYDAETAISRSASYAFVTLLLVAAFAASESVLEMISQRYIGGSAGAISGGISAAAAAALVAPLHQRVGAWADSRFQQALNAMRHALPKLLADLRETASLEEIADFTLEHVQSGVRSTRSALLVEGVPVAVRGVESRTVEQWHLAHPFELRLVDESDLLFPLRLAFPADSDGPVRLLLLGPRPDSSVPGGEERKALLEVAEPVARALHIAAERERRRAIEKRYRDRLEARICRLQQRIEILESRPPADSTSSRVDG